MKTGAGVGRTGNLTHIKGNHCSTGSCSDKALILIIYMLFQNTIF